MARSSASKSKIKVPRRSVGGTKKKKKTPRATAAPKRSRPLVAGMKWTTKAPRLRTAAARGGQYVLVGDGLANWTAEWRPEGGRVAYLMLRATAANAQLACERHYIETQTDAMLVREGAAELADPVSKGAATTWKRGR